MKKRAQATILNFLPIFWLFPAKKLEEPSRIFRSVIVKIKAKIPLNGQKSKDFWSFKVII